MRPRDHKSGWKLLFKKDRGEFHTQVHYTCEIDVDFGMELVQVYFRRAGETNGRLDACVEEDAV